MIELSLRPRALAEVTRALEGYAEVGHAAPFLREFERTLDAIRELPHRFPRVYRDVHRALLHRYPWAVFYRLRPAGDHAVVLAVTAQRADPHGWPR